MVTVSGTIAKAVGAAGLGLVLYDAHADAVHQGQMTMKDKKASALAHHLKSDMMLETPSIVHAKLKERVFHYSLDENLSGFFNNISGYFTGLNHMLVNEAIPLGLSVGTLLTKGIASKLFAGGLLAYGAMFIAKDVFGIGAEHH